MPDVLLNDVDQRMQSSGTWVKLKAWHVEDLFFKVVQIKWEFTVSHLVLRGISISGRFVHETLNCHEESSSWMMERWPENHRCLCRTTILPYTIFLIVYTMLPHELQQNCCIAFRCAIIIRPVTYVNYANGMAWQLWHWMRLATIQGRGHLAGNQAP